MFDPTVYENLRVVLEGAVYDLDLAGTIRITAREDLVDLAAMSRCYRIAFTLARGAADAGNAAAGLNGPQQEAEELPPLTARIELSAGLRDLAAEILEQPESSPGCSIKIIFTRVLEPGVTEEQACARSLAALQQVWGDRFQIRQTISHEYGAESAGSGSGSLSHAVRRIHRMGLLFGRKFGEEVVEDIPPMVDHAVLTLQQLAGGG
ncbi:MAG: hypothetical protein K0R57_2325 [Paenibacillaceae bacterium]|jgi:hypothetical protein|nr:hypothetical protein [Paenibacillaceae bacterium]